MTLGKDFRLPTEVKPKTYDADLRLDLDGRTGSRDGWTIALALGSAAPRDHRARRRAWTVASAAAELPDGRRLAATATADAASETITLDVPGASAPARQAGRSPTGAPSAPGCAASTARARWPSRSSRRPTRGASSPASTSRRSRRSGEIAVAGVPPERGRARRTASPRRDESDGRGGRRVTFAPTPPLSSYLVALIVGPIVPSAVGAGARRPDPHLDDAREAAPDVLRPGDGRGRAAAARGLLRPPLPLRQARSDRRPRLRGGRDGERGRRHLPRGGAARRSGHRAARRAEAGRRGDHARAGPPVVRQPGHDGLVGRPVAQRGVRHLDGLQDRRRLAAVVAHLDGLRGGQGGGAGARRAGLGAPHPRRDQERRGGGRVVRRHHLREGRRRAAHDRGVPGRRAVSRRHPALHAAPPRGQRHRRRSVGRARRGVRAADRRDGQRVDPPDRLSAGQPVARAWRRRPDLRGPGAAPVLRRAGGGRARVGHALAGPDGAAFPRRGRDQGAAGAARRAGGAGSAGGRGPGRLVHRQRRVARLLSRRLRTRGARRASCPRWASCDRPSGWRWSRTPGHWCGPGKRRSKISSSWSEASATRPITSCSTSWWESSRSSNTASWPRRTETASARSWPICSARRRRRSAGARRLARSRTTRRVSAARCCCGPWSSWRARPPPSPRRRPGCHPRRSIRTCSTPWSRRRRAAPTRPASRSCARAHGRTPTRRPSGVTCTRWLGSSHPRWPPAPSRWRWPPTSPCRTSRRTSASCSATAPRARPPSS